MIRWMRYVDHAKVSAFKAQGWRSLGPVVGYMGIYSELMEWPHENEPPEAPQ